MIFANVMPNRKSIYIPSVLDLRSKGLQFVSVLEVANTGVVLRFTKYKENVLVSNVSKLYFDEKHKQRKHTIIKHKGLTELMHEFNHMDKWEMKKTGESLPLWIEFVLIPKS